VKKHWWQSKTIWFGAAVFCAAVLNKLGVNVDLPENMHNAVDADTIAMIVSVVFMVLRKLTDKPIGK